MKLLWLNAKKQMSMGLYYRTGSPYLVGIKILDRSVNSDLNKYMALKFNWFFRIAVSGVM
jgi:hypothetical protein